MKKSILPIVSARYEPKVDIVYLDMDGVLCNFCKSSGVPIGEWRASIPLMEKKGFFRNLDPIDGAIEAVNILNKMQFIDLRVLSKPTNKNLGCASEKLYWLEEHLPFLVKKTTLTFDKTKLIGDYLIDDMPQIWKNFQGHVWFFDQSKPIESWKKIVTHFKLREGIRKTNEQHT